MVAALSPAPLALAIAGLAGSREIILLFFTGNTLRLGFAGAGVKKGTLGKWWLQVRLATAYESLQWKLATTRNWVGAYL